MLRITFDNLALLKRLQDVVIFNLYIELRQILGYSKFFTYFFQKPTYSREELLRDYDRNEKEMEYRSYYPLFWKVDTRIPTAPGCNPPTSLRPTVYLQINTEKGPLGRVEIELRADIVPLAAENFRGLCTGKQGLTYRCSAIHRVVPNIYWQGGTIAGGKSIYGDFYKTENYKYNSVKSPSFNI